MTRSS